MLEQSKHLRLMYAKTGLGKHANFQAFHAQLIEVARSAVPPPSWSSPRSHAPLWPGVLVLICEFSIALQDPAVGGKGIRDALAIANSGEPATVQAAVSAAVAAADAAFNDGRNGGRCHQAIVIQEFLKVMAPAPKERPAYAEAEAMLGLAAHGLAPKLFWWTCPEVLAIIQGARARA